VRTLEDLEKLKIRSTGLSAKIVQALGGGPVAMPQGQTYEALQKGIVEGTFGPIEVLKGWRQAEVIRYTTDCRSIGYTTSMFVVMNLNKWNSLPDDVKGVIEDVSSEWMAVHGESWDVDDEEGLKFTLSLKNEIINPSAEENARWKKAVQPVIDDYIETSRKNGLDGKGYVELLYALINRYAKE